MPSPAEIAAGGNVVPLRTGSAPVEQTQPGPASALGPVSPELALVDPELRQAARELLPDLPRPAPVASPPVERTPRILEPVPELAPPRRRRRRRRLGLVSSAAGILALGVLLTLVVGREELPFRRAQQTQSVAAAVSPTTATVTQPVPRPVTQPDRRATTPAKPAAPTTPPATSAPVHANAVRGQTFVWVASPNAAAYEFQLFQGGQRIFRARVDEARLELPGRWRQAGRPYALLPGSYRWYVWIISKGTNRQAKKPTVSAKLMVDDQPQ